ncbi:helix-turn-helix domain-containing protein [Enterovirga sp.]|jgi:excisionase family DNA binding protein|uniref:helix-turn-helix domain-containing protein n=1 Tax=Enterovirga sp. TaxID=2026350 RepID=UPI002618789F|nr:helix-turn-helix domain-containing protein [Enterovirga sp.]
MPAAARARVFDDRLPSDAEIENANHLRQVLASQIKDNEPTCLRLALDAQTRAEVVLSPALARSFMDLLRHVGSGRAVTIVPTEERLTTQRAADLLNVSRPHLIKLLERKEIPHTMVGRHRRVRAQDLFEYRERRDAERAAALSELAEMDADLI